MSQLTPELMDQVRALSDDDRERLRDLLDEEEGPPANDIDWAEIQRRCDAHAADPSSSLTREQAREQLRAEMRKLGWELP